MTDDTKDTVQTAAASQAPVETIRDGGTYAKLWERQSKKGRFVAIEIGRTYKTPDGRFHESNSYTRTGLMKLEGVIRRASDAAQKLEEHYRVQDRDQLDAQDHVTEEPVQADLLTQRDRIVADAKPSEKVAERGPPDKLPDM